MTTDFWVLFIGQEYARLFKWDHATLTEIITPLKDNAGQPLQGFPLTIIPPEDKFKQAAGTGDRGSDYENARIKHFFQLVDSELQKALKTYGSRPVILCGTPKHIVLFKETTHHPDVIARDIAHTYDDQKSPVHLKKDVMDAIKAYHQQQEKDLLQEFEDAANTRRQACGITYVWEMASTGRVHKLLIEPNLPEVGRIDPENRAHLQIFSEKSDASIIPIAGILTQETIQHGGTVHIVQPGTLKKCQGVGAILRY